MKHSFLVKDGTTEVHRKLSIPTLDSRPDAPEGYHWMDIELPKHHRARNYTLNEAGEVVLAG